MKAKKEALAKLKKSVASGHITGDNLAAMNSKITQLEKEIAEHEKVAPAKETEPKTVTKPKPKAKSKEPKAEPKTVTEPTPKAKSKEPKKETKEAKIPDEVIASFKTPVDVKKLIMEISGDRYKLRRIPKPGSSQAKAESSVIEKYASKMIAEHDKKYRTRAGNVMRPVIVELGKRKNQSGEVKHKTEIDHAKSISNSMQVISSAADRSLMKFDKKASEAVEKGLKAIALASVPSNNLSEYFKNRTATAHSLQELGIFDIDWKGRAGSSPIKSIKMTAEASKARTAILKASENMTKAVKFEQGGNFSTLIDDETE